MMLERNTYREAITDVRLTEEVGMELVEGAIKRKEQRGQKLRARAIATVAGIMVVFLSANGICFAQTGMNLWDLVHSFYEEGNSPEVAENVVKMFRQSGESIVDEDLGVRFTLESYFYDSSNGEVLASLRMDSLDGTPIEEKQEEWFISGLGKDFRIGDRGSIGHVVTSDPIVSADKKSLQLYYSASMMGLTEIEADVDEPISFSIQTVDSRDGGETMETHYKNVGSFLLEPTGKLKNLELDETAIDGCEKALITPSSFYLFLGKRLDYMTADESIIPDDIKSELDENNQLHPFSYVELKMKDGASYYLAGEGKNIEYIWDEGSDDPVAYKLTGPEFGNEGKEIPADRVLCQFWNSGSGFDGYTESGYTSFFTGYFKTFLDVDEVAAVYINGVEIPVK
ncbi:hypothetical protein AALC25_14865 [Lachnospiraceae bacterium 29-84]